MNHRFRLLNCAAGAKLLAGLTCVLGSLAAAPAAITVSVDMDLATPGIQSVRPGFTGDTFTVGIVLTVDSNGVSSYGISASFDSTELALNGSPASTELLPNGMSNLTAGVVSEGIGSVYTFEAVTLGNGPVNTNLLIGTIAFKVKSPIKDSTNDISVGFFNAGVDGAYDNAGNAVLPTFLGGLLMPYGPRLRDFRTTSNTVVIAWPAPSAGFSLQQNSNLVAANWSSVTNPGSVVGSENQVIINPAIGRRFYRLLNP